MIIRNPHCANNRRPGERATDLPQTRKRGLSGVLSGRASLKLDTPNLVGNAPVSNYFFAEFRGFFRVAKRQRSIPPKSRTLSLPFNQSGPNPGSAQSSMADMWIATGPWD